MKEKLLDLDGVSVTLHKHDADLPLVRDATFEVREGEIVCLVGESGSGKSVTARTIMGLTQMDKRMKVRGRAMFGDVDLFELRAERYRALRGRDLAMVFQEPMSSLDPVFTVESQLVEAFERREKASKQARTARLKEALAEVGIHDAERVLRSYPHELSGGMSQRVMIAMALLGRPRLLLADEPTTALDVTIQAQILELIERVREEEKMSVLLVTHDMGVAATMADRVVVMYAGRVVEDADPTRLFAEPRHPYSEGLLACVPPMRGERLPLLPTIPGSVPDPSRLPPGCAFEPRCPNSTEKCVANDPPLEVVDHTAFACYHPNSRLEAAS